MAFQKKTWKDRLVEFAGRRTLKRVSGSAESTLVVDISRNEGTISQAGDAFSAANMNDLEQRIADAVGGVESELSGTQQQINNIGSGLGAQVTFSVVGTTLYINPK